MTTEVQHVFQPFTGEIMQCFICGVKEQSHPGEQSQWRCVQLDKYFYYVCPSHFPADDAPAALFKEAYEAVLEVILKDYNARIHAESYQRRNGKRRIQ
jgi:hypothetical protein